MDKEKTTELTYIMMELDELKTNIESKYRVLFTDKDLDNEIDEDDSQNIDMSPLHGI